MLRIEEIVGAVDDDFRDMLMELPPERLKALLADRRALDRLRPVGVTAREAAQMIAAILADRTAAARQPATEPTPPPASRRSGRTRPRRKPRAAKPAQAPVSEVPASEAPAAPALISGSESPPRRLLPGPAVRLLLPPPTAPAPSPFEEVPPMPVRAPGYGRAILLLLGALALLAAVFLSL